ncbi:uncharacterized protein PgNI_12412 [Pyricularia grisea]|uniref:Uncharacterized protein n=1 Tax=Pyricularia grisea TaxID=148305 RepID=A0A6P8AMI7_PYRGI|nr:uncharacterized protein PgNI_12412 [Pyricularia grisea]TLD03242.1 hypothetical protein PgNI_12412 [Pyricularia grisea]
MYFQTLVVFRNTPPSSETKSSRRKDLSGLPILVFLSFGQLFSVYWLYGSLGYLAHPTSHCPQTHVLLVFSSLSTGRWQLFQVKKSAKPASQLQLVLDWLLKPLRQLLLFIKALPSIARNITGSITYIYSCAAYKAPN